MANLKLPWKRAEHNPHGKAVKVSILVTEYLKSPKYKNLGNGTKIRYQSAFRLFELLVLANGKNIFQMQAHKVDYSIVDYIHSVLSHSHAQGTIKFLFSVMSTVFEVAMRNGRVPYNPWSKNGVRVDNERDVIWTEEQLRAAVEAARELGYFVLALYLIIGYETGIRMWSDLRRLTWDNIREEAGVKVLDFVMAKTNVRIILPLSPVALASLKDTGNSSGPLFADDKGRLLSSVALTQQLNKVKRKALLPQELTFRDLRRSFVTDLATKGATISEITATMGWKSPNGVINRYARVRFDTALNAMQKKWEKA